MFEVGKRYLIGKHGSDIYECIAIHERKGWLVLNGKPFTYDWTENCKEYKEPRTITRWVNVYEKGGELFTFPETRVHESKEMAEKLIVYYNDDVKYVATISFSYTEPH